MCIRDRAQQRGGRSGCLPAGSQDEKEALGVHTLEAISKRCSLKTHLSKKLVEPEKIAQVLDAARLAPSARNLQPWRFVVVQGDEAIAQLANAFNETNQE